MSTSILVSIISSYFIVLFAGSVKLKYISAEATNDFPIMSFGFSFFHKYSHLMGNKTIDLQSNCSMQLQIVENVIKRKELWALKFADAWAKIPAGILYGNNMDMGNFDECLSISEHLEAGYYIQGKYCLTNLEVTKHQKEKNLNFSNHFNFELGICIPSACEAFEIQLLFNKYLETFWNISWYDSSLKITEDKCTLKNRGPLKVWDWIAIGVLIMLGALLVFSTFYDYLVQKQKKPTNHLLSSFSVHKNLSQLMRLTPNNETANHIIPALDGIRCLSLFSIIFLHSFLFVIESPTTNTAEFYVWQETPFYMVWKMGTYAVDSFFFLSGLLLISVAFREMERYSGRLNIPLFYFHRFVRLSPILYLAVLLSTTLFRFSANGPMWHKNYHEYKVCQDTWWATLLYVQNYATLDKMCVKHSWYLAVDMQLYIISPLLLIPIWRWRKWGLTVLTSIGCLLIIYLFILIIVKDVIVFTKEPGLNDSEFNKAYYSTHTRASPWIIGIIFGYYLHFHKNRRFVLSKLFVILGWIIAVSLFLTVIFALYPKTQPGATDITPLEGAFYLPLSHVAWPLGLCWVVFACVHGYGGPINEFLSCTIWQPLSKLSYCMYIWHFIIIHINTGRIRTNLHFSSYDGCLHFWRDFGISLIVSTLMYLAVEAPILQLEKYLLKKNRV